MDFIDELIETLVDLFFMGSSRDRLKEDPSLEHSYSSFFPFGLLAMVAGLLFLSAGGAAVFLGSDDSGTSLAVGPVSGTLLGFSVLFFLVGFYLLFVRFGVTNEVLWQRNIFSRKQIAFHEIEKISHAPIQDMVSWGTTHTAVYPRFVVSSADQELTINDAQKDYGLALIRIIEELNKRRFQLGEVTAYDPGWEQEAQKWRQFLGDVLLSGHQRFYEQNPEADQYLNRIVMGLPGQADS
ncbi:hypothetical protein BSR28_05200 [Boudabousia liubingyangii]|uniref:hypothetical protein n=1 Tax=Boudabousia liubingyangii TaxID=1921764 RepID=UPI00093A7CEB|nr:hypothetical protein [Boudabousia liubingyangii]OKL46836.1 hypothetical protein BSR28_05200 [Boudabousia liubingyangii]